MRLRRYKLIGAGAGGLLLLVLVIVLVRSWMGAEVSVPRERVRIAEVTRGDSFVTSRRKGPSSRQ